MSADVGIIAAMEDECRELIQLLENREAREIGPYTFYTGKLQNRDICLLQCGIGKVNAAVGTALMIENWQPRNIINTGVAGGFLPSLKIGDIVLSTDVLHHDVDVTIFGYRKGQLPGAPESFRADADLLSKASSLKPEDPSIKLIPGRIASGDIFVHLDQQVEKIREDFDDIAAVEMESAAIAQVCHSFKIPFLIIRSISDITGDKENHVSYEEFMPLAAKNSIDMIMKILKQ